VLPEPVPYPLLPWSLDARIVLALRDRLLADAPLRTVFLRDDQIALVEMATLLRAETLTPPCLALSILADEERETTSSYGATYTTIVQLALVTKPPAAWGDTAGLLRSRLVAQIRRVLRAEAGALTDSEGTPLTEALTRIQRVQLDATPLPSNLLLTLLNAEYRSTLDLNRQEALA
jgi:hypothetical protein